MGVEKVAFLKKLPELGDRKCPGDPRESFIAHPDTILFLRFSLSRVFQQPRLITSIEDGSMCDESPSWRCEIWKDGVLVLSTPAWLELVGSVWTLADSLKLPRVSQPHVLAVQHGVRLGR